MIEMNDNGLTPFEDNVLQLISAQYIMLCRIYDQLALLIPEDKAIELRNMHIEGKTFSPAPYLAEDDDE